MYKKMKMIYVAGPFRADSAWKIERNIRRAEEKALALWKAGAAVLCPHANTRFFQNEAPDETWLKGDLEMLRRCDGVLFLDRWTESEGATLEHDYAQMWGIPCFYYLSDVLEWLHES